MAGAGLNTSRVGPISVDGDGLMTLPAGGGIIWTGRARLTSGATNSMRLQNAAGNGGAYFQLQEMTAPTGTASAAQIYALDDGSKTDLLAFFQSGSGVVINQEA